MERDYHSIEYIENPLSAHLRELRAAEGLVLLLLVQRADALLEREQALVDLRALLARGAAAVRRV